MNIFRVVEAGEPCIIQARSFGHAIEILEDRYVEEQDNGPEFIEEDIQNYNNYVLDSICNLGKLVNRHE